MKKYSLVLFFLLTPLFALAIDGNELLRQLDDVFYPEKYAMKFRLVNSKKDGRVYRYTMTEIGIRNLGSLLTFVEPKREIGKKILMRNDNLWLSTPNTSHPVKLSKKESFMGSNFSNNDLLDSSLADDYNAKIVGEEACENRMCYVVDAKATEAARKRKSISYDRLKVWITKEDIMALKIEYYTRSGNLLKVMTLDTIKVLVKRKRPTHMTMLSEVDKNTITEVFVDAMVEEPSLNNNMFSMKAL